MQPPQYGSPENRCILPNQNLTRISQGGMMALIRRFLFCSLLTGVALGQVKTASAPPPEPPAPVISPEVHPDNSVTFRLKDPNAKSVLLRLEGQPKPMGMERRSGRLERHDGF